MFFGKDSQAERLSCGGFRHKVLIYKDILKGIDTFGGEMRRFAVIPLLLLSCSLWAQEPRFVNYSSADGLPSNTVYAITQDADGVQFKSWKEYGRVNALAVDHGGDWNEGRFVGLTDNIRPGRYSLEEQSSDIFGRWNQGESVLQMLRVPPPIWLRWPFLLGYLLLLSAIVYTVMKLRERRILVKELDMRNRLFLIVSHDIRSPVSGNYILSRELLEKVDGLSRVQLKEALAELSASAENASSLLENLLLWSLSQKGMLKPVMREVNLLGVAKEAVGSVRGQDVITVDIPENLIVRTDRNMLLTILRNLLDNAVKASQHSDIPGAPVILRSEATKDLLHARQIVIIDNGLGLREEAPEWGHGLGLVITRELVDKLCARMEMHNRPEGGLQITIDL